MNSLLNPIRNVLLFNRIAFPVLRSSTVLSGHNVGSERRLSTTSRAMTYMAPEEIDDRFPRAKRWPLKNLEVYPPQGPEEDVRRATFCYNRDNIKYSPKKMWYICCLIRGLSVDEAVKQLSFVGKKGAHIAREILLEAQAMAVKEQGFEYASDMYVGECFCSKGLVVKGIRKHARYRFGEVRYFHTHFFVRLVEGPAPPYYYDAPLSNRQKLDLYVDNLRRRNIKYSI